MRREPFRWTSSVSRKSWSAAARLKDGVAEARIETADTEIASAHRAQPPYHVGQLRIAQICQAEVRPGDVCSTEVRIIEVCSVEVGAGEVGQAEVCGDQARADQICDAEIGAAEVCSIEGCRSNMQLSGS